MFHLFKQTRVYQGRPYQGPTSDGLPAEFETLQEAQEAKVVFTERNPVGWNIFDADSGRLVDGYDFFEGGVDMNGKLPTVKVELALPNPNWVAVRDENGVALNMEDWYDMFEVDAEVLTIHLRTNMMRVRFPWTDREGQPVTETRDVPADPFFERYNIVAL